MNKINVKLYKILFLIVIDSMEIIDKLKSLFQAISIKDPFEIVGFIEICKQGMVIRERFLYLFQSFFILFQVFLQIFSGGIIMNMK